MEPWSVCLALRVTELLHSSLFDMPRKHSLSWWQCLLSLCISDLVSHYWESCLTSLLCSISVREQRMPTSQSSKQNEVIMTANCLAYKGWKQVTTSQTEKKAVIEFVWSPKNQCCGWGVIEFFESLLQFLTVEGDWPHQQRTEIPL